MHEVDMTKCLLLSLQEWKQQHQPQVPSVEVVHLQVGDFTCVEPDALVFTWGALVNGTWLAGSELRIRSIEYSLPEQGNSPPAADSVVPRQSRGRDLVAGARS